MTGPLAIGSPAAYPERDVERRCDLPSIHQPIDLINATQLDRRIPPTALGEVLRLVQPTVVAATRMVIEGRSTARGRRPRWLDAATDIRLEGVELLDDRTRLRFLAPTLGEVASELYDQRELWPSRPDASATALDMLADVLDEVVKDDPDSAGFDTALLKGIGRFEAGLDHTYRSLDVTRHARRAPPVRLDRELLDRVHRLREATPDPRPVRVAGSLDMIRASTETFCLLLDDGTEISGSVAGTDIGIEALAQYFKQRVLVHAKAVFRPSGRLLRLDAERFEDGASAPGLWSRVPGPVRAAAEIPRLPGTVQRPRGVAAFFGTWPGDETESELLEALAELG